MFVEVSEEAGWKKGALLGRPRRRSVTWDPSLLLAFPKQPHFHPGKPTKRGRKERKTIRLTRNLARELSLSNPITTIKAAAYL